MNIPFTIRHIYNKDNKSLTTFNNITTPISLSGFETFASDVTAYSRIYINYDTLTSNKIRNDVVHAVFNSDFEYGDNIKSNYTKYL